MGGVSINQYSMYRPIMAGDSVSKQGDKTVIVQVREAEEKDIPDILAIWADFMDLLHLTNPNYWKVKNGRAAFSAFLANTFAKDDVLVAVAEGGKKNLTGFTLAQIEILPEWFGSEQIGMIRYQAVPSDYQGKGVGHQMTDFVLDWFRSLGTSRIELNILNGLSATKYWSKLGFKKFMDRRFIEL